MRALELLVEKYQREGNSFQTFIESYWDQADTDLSGTLTRDEVQKVAISMSPACLRALQLFLVLLIFSVDGMNTVSWDSVGFGLQVLRLMNINFQNKWFLSKFKEFDLDKSNSMDKTEFLQFVR